MQPLRIAIIGAGGHASGQHLPALCDHERLHPGSLVVAAVCDRDRDRATILAGPSGAAVYDDWQTCLQQARPDAVLVCLPPALTPTVTMAAVAAGAAVWVEKPLAPTLAEAEALVSKLGKTRAMASMNRRFEPGFIRLRELAAGRCPRGIHAVMARVDRCEPDFVYGTGIHIVDLVVDLVGPPAGSPRVQVARHHGASWHHLTWTTSEGCAVTVDIQPTLGSNLEAVELVGKGWRVEARSAALDAGHIDWHEAGKPARRECIDLALPVWQRNGTADETAAFISACRGRGPWYPSPADVLPATRICQFASEQTHS